MAFMGEYSSTKKLSEVQIGDNLRKIKLIFDTSINIFADLSSNGTTGFVAPSDSGPKNLAWLRTGGSDWKFVLFRGSPTSPIAEFANNTSGWLMSEYIMPDEDFIISSISGTSSPEWASTFETTTINLISYEQLEIGSESEPLCLNHNAISANGTNVGNNIIVNYKDENGTNQRDVVAYLSDIPSLNGYIINGENPSTINIYTDNGDARFISNDNVILDAGNQLILGSGGGHTTLTVEDAKASYNGIEIATVNDIPTTLTVIEI